MRKRKRRKTYKINRKHKDRLFRFVFKTKKDILSLYNAINGTDYQNPDDLEITTLDDVIYMGMKNDLSFLVENTLNLYEHQSTFNPNMPLRGLLYFSNIYRKYVSAQEIDIYSETLKKLPMPRYIVFYNGSKEEPDRKVLLLSDAFIPTSTDEKGCLECRATMLNINLGHNQELMAKCQKLHEYAQFIACIRQYIYGGLDLQAAVVSAVEDCIRDGILSDVLVAHRAEVVEVILTEYDAKKHMNNVRREAREEGFHEGESIFALLAQKLLEDSRVEDLKKAIQDKDFRNALYKEYGIEKK